ncbi:MAG: carboxylate--amine ligase [Acidithiobacillales bacterium SG8_45]|jgi:glutathione synthase/RimK-type ligase-like ATP-grasp enzyme|nr:MAG: carboxylate--amine ligase [Acidithiobacillales bacterium SG8_45]
MPSHLIVVENTKDWQPGYPDVEVVSARDYLLRQDGVKTKGLRVINLCRGYRYLSTGYYCSLLGEARQHRVIPSVRAITDLSSKAIYSLNIEDLDVRVQRVMRHRTQDPELQKLEVNILFGRCEDADLQEVARQLFDLFPMPLMRIEFRRTQRWQIASVKPLALNSLRVEQQDFFGQSLTAYLSSRWRTRRAPTQARYDLAILHNPDEKLPPSNMGALRKFIDAGKKVGVEVDLITRKDYGRLAEYDGLFIRETTAVNHHTYRFAKKADAEGLVVIDDPDSILQCTNKVYLAELLAGHDVATPRTVILRKGENISVGAAVGFPAVLKIPDGSFSRGIFKAADEQEAAQIMERLFKDSDLILAQEYFYTDFDWRIGLLNRTPLFACKYYMSPAHWQIVRHDASGQAKEGGYECLALDQVPTAVLNTASTAANLIGNGFYGVDLKERDGQVVVMEVNDNPNVETGVEDHILGNELYRTIMGELVARIDQRRHKGRET